MEKTIREKARAVGVRTLRTMAQTAGGLIGTYGILQGVEWGHVLSATILAGIVCVLMNL